MSDEHGVNGTTQPVATYEPSQTVWQHDDAARQWGTSEPQWSQQTTQPLGPRWPAQVRRRLGARQAAALRSRETRALGWGAGWGALLTLAVVGLLALLAVANGWLPGGASTTPDGAQFPIPVQSVSHTPIPGATAIPSTTAQPSVTVQSTATTAATATAQPTAQPTAIPTATAQPTARPTTSP